MKETQGGEYGTARFDRNNVELDHEVLSSVQLNMACEEQWEKSFRNWQEKKANVKK